MLFIAILSAICLLLCCGLLMSTIYMRMRIQKIIEDYEENSLQENQKITKEISDFINSISSKNKKYVHKNKTFPRKRKTEGNMGWSYRSRTVKTSQPKGVDKIQEEQVM